MGEKRFKGAPFGTQKARFDISAVHPQSKLPGTFTEIPYCKKSTSKENCLLGPSTYMIDKLKGDFTNKAVYQRSQGPNWKRAFEVARMAAIPHMLYRDTWEQKHQLKQQLGPGRYSIKDFVEERNCAPSSYRGVCSNLESRIQTPRSRVATPGPGSYGEGGIPSARLERRKSASNVGMMEGSSRRADSARSTGSGLAPGVYHYPSPIEQLLTKTISARGPYDLYTGPRIPKDKHLQQYRHLCPGRYQLGSFTDEFNNKANYGKISTTPRDHIPPTERIFYSTLSQWPRHPSEPGPGYYDYHKQRPRTVSYSDCAFNTMSRRLIKQKNEVPVGVGQYDIERIEHCWNKNGNCSTFVSKIPRLPPKVDSPRELMLKERITPRGVTSSLRKEFLISLSRPRNCITSCIS